MHSNGRLHLSTSQKEAVFQHVDRAVDLANPNMTLLISWKFTTSPLVFHKWARQRILGFIILTWVCALEVWSAHRSKRFPLPLMNGRQSTLTNFFASTEVWANNVLQSSEINVINNIFSGIYIYIYIYLNQELFQPSRTCGSLHHSDICFYFQYKSNFLLIH